jgi:hypothetical protein
MPFVEESPARPPYSRNRTALALEAMLEARAEEIIGVLIERALGGNMPALRLCIDRLIPRGCERPVPFPLPATVSAADAKRAAADIWAAVVSGELTPREALDLLAVVDKALSIVEAVREAEPVSTPQPVAKATEYYDPAEPGARGGDRPAENTTKYNERPGPMKEGRRPGHWEAHGWVYTGYDDDPVAPLASATDLQAQPAGEGADPGGGGGGDTPAAATAGPTPPRSRHADGPGPGYDPNHPYFRNR